MPPKLVLGLMILYQMAIILEVYVKRIMDSFALVSCCCGRLFFIWQGYKFSYVYLLHCAADCLCPENLSCDDTEKLVINEIFEVGIVIAFLGACNNEYNISHSPSPLFQVVFSESKKGPLILLIKDIEKSMIGNHEAYTPLKMKLDSLPGGVVAIGSHTQIDNRKEKVACFVLAFCNATSYLEPNV